MTKSCVGTGTDSSVEVKPNRMIMYITGGSTALQKYPGDDEMIRHISSLPVQEQNALREGVALSIRCADGVYECSLNTENGDINISPKNPKPQEVNVNLRDHIFPGEEHLLGFLQERLTKHYPIGAYLRLHFQDLSISYQIGLVRSPVIEGVQKGVKDSIEEALVTS